MSLQADKNKNISFRFFQDVKRGLRELMEVIVNVNVI
jgi:hypothetical protein